MKQQTQTAIAYSYVRFSTPDQAKGDSLRRQTEAAEAWCEKHGVALDTSTTLHDLGKSAFTGSHRVNPDRHALAGFLKLVEAGKIPRGSYLVLENLDRLTREHIQPALLLALNLLQSGIRIVQLKPAEMVFDDKSDTLPVMMMMMELSRGHGESAIKSERIGAAWREKKQRARDGEPQKETKRIDGESRVLTRKLPAWLQERNGSIVAVPKRAAVVKRIFALAIAGYGLKAIVKKFTAEKVPPFTAGATWNHAYIHMILKDRRALGEYQPRDRADKPDGDIIRGYYPAIVSEEEYDAARAGAAQRQQKPGRGSLHPNIFAGLLRDALDGDTYFATTRVASPSRPRSTTQRVLINTSSSQGLAPIRSFPFETFERALLSMLREIDPVEILNGDHPPDESLVLSNKVAAVEARIGKIEAELLSNGDVVSLARVLRQLEGQKADLNTKLSAARQKAANPLSEAWGEGQSLMQALDSAADPDDARTRLRSALRRMVDGIYLLIIPRGYQRLCAAQVWFTGGKKCRSYLILHTPPKSNGKRRVEGGWSVKSFTTGGKGLDLRSREDAAALAETLATVEI